MKKSKKNKLHKKAKKFINTIDNYKENEGYKPKFSGKSNVVSYDIDGLVKSHCECAEWTNGEGYDFSFETQNHDKSWHSEKISLHWDEIEIMLACLNKLNFFGEIERED